MMNVLGEYTKLKCAINHNSKGKKSRLCHIINRSEIILRNTRSLSVVVTERDIQVEQRDHVADVLLLWSIKSTRIILDTVTDPVL